MYTAEINFKLKRGKQSDDVDFYIGWFLATLSRNGQIADGDMLVTVVRGGCTAIVELPEPDSLRPSRFNKQIRDALRKLRTSGVGMGPVRLLGEEAGSTPVCRCRKPASLVLGTDMFSTKAPLTCGKCLGVVPLYRLPHTTEYENYEDVVFWARRYRILDELWIGSGVGEQFAYRELSRHDSDLSDTGRDICRRIEKCTGIPTYYYLQRYYARSVASERRRPCPSCGKKWLKDPPWMDRYEFRCDRCRLVSNIGSDVQRRDHAQEVR